MIRTQLRVYYGLRGLIGNALKHAIKLDMLSLERQGGSDNPWGIAGSIYYADSPEGGDYWRVRNDAYPSDEL